MQVDPYGVSHLSSDEACELLYSNPALDLSLLRIDDPSEYNHHVSNNYAEFEILQQYIQSTGSIDEFDRLNQNNWFMPDEYKRMDIAKFILDRCVNEGELQRAASELMLFLERDLFPLLCYLKYMVDVFRANNIVWGVGRGSSVASFLLYKLDVHRVNSLYYGLSIEEFLK